jgi:hypothetical protein
MMSESTLTNKLLNALYGDRVIWTVMVILGLFSLLAVYSATGTLAYKESGGNTESFLIKHGLILALGLLVTYIVHLLHYMTFSKSAPLLLLVSIPLLIYTILFGAEYNDARRWISLPWVGVTHIVPFCNPIIHPTITSAFTHIVPFCNPIIHPTITFIFDAPYLFCIQSRMGFRNKSILPAPNVIITPSL